MKKLEGTIMTNETGAVTIIAPASKIQSYKAKGYKIVQTTSEVKKK